MAKKSDAEEEYNFLQDILTLINEDTTGYTDEEFAEHDEELYQWATDAEAFLDSDDVLLHRSLLHQIVSWLSEDFNLYTEEQREDYEARKTEWVQRVAHVLATSPPRPNNTAQPPAEPPALTDITKQLRNWGEHKLTEAKQKAKEKLPSDWEETATTLQTQAQTVGKKALTTFRTLTSSQISSRDDLDNEIRAWIEQQADVESLTPEAGEAHAAKLMDLTARAGPDRIKEILEEYRPDEETALVPVPEDEHYIRILTVSVPPSTKWQPEIAQSLIMNLFDISLPTAPLVLQIRASLNHIRWTIEAPRDVSEVVRRTLYSLYPHAQVEETSKTTAPVGHYRFDFHTGNAYMVPISSAEDFTKTDPLASVVGSLVNLEPDEEVIYELAISRPSFNYSTYGEKYITQSRIGVLNFIVPVAMIHGAAMAASGQTRSDKYVPEIQKKLRAKLHNPCKDVDFSLKVKAHSPERAKMIANGVVPSLAPYYLEHFNFPVPAGKGTHPLVLSAQEVAALWHLPNELCQSPGIVWSAAGVSPLPTALLSQTSGMLLGENHYQGRTHPVYLSYPDRVTHVNLIGKTRVGKSTLLHHIRAVQF